MTITGALALFAALWASVLKRNKFRVKASQIQNESDKIEELRGQQESLLFFFIIGAERGEIEVRLASGATRRRSRLPSPLQLRWTGKTPLQLPQRREALLRR